MKFDLILMMRDIYINSNLNPLTKFTSSSRSTEFKDILPWNISQMITKTVPISTGIVISYARDSPSSAYALRGREGVKAKAYTHCFYEVILLSKGVQGGREYLKIT